MITRKVLQIILSCVNEGKMSVDDAAEVIMECAGNVYVKDMPFFTTGEGNTVVVPSQRLGEIKISKESSISSPSEGISVDFLKASRP